MSEEERYHQDLACAFVRGMRPDAPELPPEALMDWGRAQGLRLHKFKQNTTLPRVRRVLGLLKGLSPVDLLDVGSGRGTFLWPLVTEFPELPVTAVDIDPRRVDNLDAVRRGGVPRLRALRADIARDPLPQADVVTALEVMEHLPDPAPAAQNLLRAARRALVCSVPSQPDNNPEHLRLYTPDSLTALWREAGASRVRIEHVFNHMIALVTPGA